jgi:hypothetical protein
MLDLKAFEDRVRIGEPCGNRTVTPAVCITGIFPANARTIRNDPI